MLGARFVRSYWKAPRKGMDMIVIPNRGKVVALITALALAGGLLTLALLAKPTQAQPPTANENGAVVEDFPYEVSLDAAECTGEVINIEGTMHTVTNFVRVQGGYHYHVTFSLANARGVGLDPQTLEPTGSEYVFHSSITSVENFLPTGDSVAGDVHSETATGEGSSPDLVFYATGHYILTEDGVVKMEVGQFSLKCPGSETAPSTAAASAAATTP
jgi:hypothetical protein